MKKIIALIFIFVFLFTACGVNSDKGDAQQTTLINKETDCSSEEEFRGAWLSYIELTVTQERRTREKYAQYIGELLDNMRELKISDVFVQVRPFADALYFSRIFPSSTYASAVKGEEPAFDILETVIEEAEKRDMYIHAWINPYRISTSENKDIILYNKAVRELYKENSNEHVAVSPSGIYFNPSSLKAQQLIVEGVREILENYNIRGIHIDDYFYFPDCGDFDSQQYGAYLSSGGELSLEDWRRENVSSLLASLYLTVKAFGEDKIFSVSPSGNISLCYEEHYADIYLWCSTPGYCDMIIPQLYFGFDHGGLPFEKCLEAWAALERSEKVSLVGGLALYKAGQRDDLALSGSEEWLREDDIISRQVISLREKEFCGFSLYSGSYINFSETFLSEQLQNLKSVL